MASVVASPHVPPTSAATNGLPRAVVGGRAVGPSRAERAASRADCPTVARPASSRRTSPTPAGRPRSTAIRLSTPRRGRSRRRTRTTARRPWPPPPAGQRVQARHRDRVVPARRASLATNSCRTGLASLPVPYSPATVQLPTDGHDTRLTEPGRRCRARRGRESGPRAPGSPGLLGDERVRRECSVVPTATQYPDAGQATALIWARPPRPASAARPGICCALPQLPFFSLSRKLLPASVEVQGVVSRDALRAGGARHRVHGGLAAGSDVPGSSAEAARPRARGQSWRERHRGGCRGRGTRRQDRDTADPHGEASCYQAGKNYRTISHEAPLGPYGAVFDIIWTNGTYLPMSPM